MTKSEKGYFKKHANLTGGDKVYLKLFDAIDSQNTYDENKLKEKFKGEQFLKQFSVAKNSLYSQILKSLNQSSISTNSRFELRTNTNNAEILFNKGLIGQALKMISKLKSQAYEIEELDVLLQLIDLEKTILLKSFEDNQSKLDNIHEEELDILSKRKNFIHYQKLFNKSYYLITKFGHLRDKADERHYDKILNSVYMKNEKLADSIMSKIHYCEILLHYNVSKMKYSDAIKFTTRLLGLMEKNRVFMAAHIDKYLSVYQNHILQYFYLAKYNDMEENSKRLLNMLNDKKLKIPERAKIMAIGKLLSIRFVAYINSANFEAGSKIFNEVKDYMNRYNDLVDNSIKIILYNLSSYHNFLLGNYSEALVWINKMLNDPEMKYFTELICNAKWYELLIHYELKNYDYIDNVLKTNKRYLNKNQKFYGIEKIMIKFYNRVVNSDFESEKELFHELLNEVKKVTGKNTVDYGVDYYNITGWVRSKIEGITFKTYLEQGLWQQN